jgi:CubicO group peptidase (beta-lactamase class C family)
VTLDFDAAASYAGEHGLHALVAARADRVLLERYAAGAQHAAHPLYSGTKSFWGITALEAQRERLLTLDQRVASKIAEFGADLRRDITVRMLLQMTAGYGFGGLGRTVPTFDRVIEIPLKDRPGERFTYGGIPLQVFGAFFSRLLAEHHLTPYEYLCTRVLDPAGAHVASWRILSDGSYTMPTGARLTPYDWLAFGMYVLRNRDRYAEAFEGSHANPRYGLGWWLECDGVPTDLFYASGSGGQALYVVPSEDLVVVHFSESKSFRHDAFLKRLFATPRGGPARRTQRRSKPPT